MFAVALLQDLGDDEIDMGKHLVLLRSAFLSINQNCRICGTQNPHAGVASSLSLPKVMVWAGITSKGLIGLFFQRKRLLQHTMRTFCVIICWNKMITSWFLQDGAWPHRTAKLHNFIDKHLDDCVIFLEYCTQKEAAWISLSVRQFWPSVPFCCGGYLKDQVYHQIHKCLGNWNICDTIPAAK